MKTVSDYRALARARLPRFIFDYIDGGSISEQTLRANVADFSRLTVRQRVMVDVSVRTVQTDILGVPAAMPVALGPVGLAGMYARRGEIQAALAARDAGVPFCLSTLSICGLQEVKQATGIAPWFQVYLIKDRGYLRELLAAAAEIGSEVLVFTVDLPVPSPRYGDFRSGFRQPRGLRRSARIALDLARHPGWTWDVLLRGRPVSFGNFANHPEGGRGLKNFDAWVAKNYEQKITWADLDWIRSIWPGKVIMKGILDVQDAAQAATAGTDGIIVSNHGGRQLDGAPSTISMLPRIVDRIGTTVPVFLDGGVRSGLDVVKAVALGARACFLGRAWAYALGAEGRHGVQGMLATIERDVKTVMALAGCNDIKSIDRAILADGNSEEETK